MPKTTVVTNELLIQIRDELQAQGKRARAWQIANALKDNHNIIQDESTIRGRFIEMGQPLSGTTTQHASLPTIKEQPEDTKKVDKNIPEILKGYVPHVDQFDNYIEREVDRRLATHYKAGKYPITQGKQGTGKTFSHMYYAFRQGLPFLLFSCYEDFKLPKLFGDKTIINGSVKFQESMFTVAIQNPSVILFDEINAVSNSNTFDFHALLQNRELFIKDADDGLGRVYKLHPGCRIGFSQNPKSAKYVGGNIKPSNFLGRCTYITYPEFSNAEIKKAITKKFPKLDKDAVTNFTKFYFACCETIEKAQIPVDISIRQLNNVIELYSAGMTLRNAIEDGLTSILEAVSQPKAKEAFMMLAQATWKELLDKDMQNNASAPTQTMVNFILLMRRKL